MNTHKEVAGITYTMPTVTILQQSPLLVAEYAGRTAYDSFENSEHESIRNKNTSNLDAEHSELLDSLAWVHHHHSVLEHLSITYLLEGVSRGVLQELVRHRVASYTVKSTRFTMSSVINAFITSLTQDIPQQWFRDKVKELDMFVVQNGYYLDIELRTIHSKLSNQFIAISDRDKTDATEMLMPFLELCLSKENIEHISSLGDLRGEIDGEALFNTLEKGRKKRNVGDIFKHIVTDNFKCDIVVTFNLRSLKNFFTLRDSGASYFQIRWLAQEMEKVTPKKYLDLIIKNGKIHH